MKKLIFILIAGLLIAACSGQKQESGNEMQDDPVSNQNYDATDSATIEATVEEFEGFVEEVSKEVDEVSEEIDQIIEDI